MLLKTRERCVCPKCGRCGCFMVLERAERAGVKFCDTCQEPTGLTGTEAEQARSAIAEATRSAEIKETH